MSQIRFALKRISLAACLFLFALASRAQVPEWIWHSNNGHAATNNEVRFFRKTFTVDELGKRAIIAVAADDEADVWVNGKRVMTATGWKSGSHANVAKELKKGENTIA